MFEMLEDSFDIKLHREITEKLEILFFKSSVKNKPYIHGEKASRSGMWYTVY